MVSDELYEVDEQAFAFLAACAGNGASAGERDFVSYCLSEGILSETPARARRQRPETSPLPSLRYLELLITDRCNLTCRHCYLGEPAQRELPLDVIIDVLDQFEEIQGLRVLISGGEPLLHRDFDGLNEYLSSYPLRRVLFTNGLLLDKRRLENLSVEEIQVSIDGLEEAHDALRGRGSFKKALRALRLAREEGFDVSVSTMVHPGNLGDFDAMEALFSRMEVKDWTVDVPCATGRMLDNGWISLPPEKAGRYMRYGYGRGFHGSAGGFACGLHLLSVLPDGSVAKCAFYSDRPVGHVSEGLRECRGRVRPLRIVETRCDCDMLDVCRGGCRFRAGLSGDPLGKDLYRCAAFGRGG